MWFKTQKQINKEIEEVLSGSAGSTFKDVDLIAGKDKDIFLTDKRGQYEPVLFAEKYALVRLPKDFVVEGYDIKVTHVASFCA